jgi:hypothetical protein
MDYKIQNVLIGVISSHFTIVEEGGGGQKSIHQVDDFIFLILILGTN